MSVVGETLGNAAGESAGEHVGSGSWLFHSSRFRVGHEFETRPPRQDDVYRLRRLSQCGERCVVAVGEGVERSEMEIGIGLPSMVPGTPRDAILEWSRAADLAGFSTLGVLDRLVYDCWEPLIALGTAAAVTERIRLLSSVLIAPYRADEVVLAKQAATLALLSRGRFWLGMAVGFREDDYRVAGTAYGDRGRRLNSMVHRFDGIWSGRRSDGAEPIGPIYRPELAFGGQSPAAIRRAGRLGRAWIAGGSSPATYEDTVARAYGVWEADGIVEYPRKIALAYYALGESGSCHAETYLGRYYSFLGPQFSSMVVGNALTTSDDIRRTIETYRDAGCDELVFFPCHNGIDQLQALADVAQPSIEGV